MTITAELFDGTKMEFPDGTDPSVIARVAKEQTMARKAAGGGQSPAMSAGMSKLSGMSQNPEVAPQQRGFGATMYDNFIGSNDGVNSVGEKIATLLNMGGESMTMGVVGDEAAAGADALLGRGGGYDQNLAKYRGKETQMREDHPLASIGADIGGGILPAFAGLGLVSAARSLPGMIGRGIGYGAGAGASVSFLDGEGGIANRATDGIGGAIIGGALGGAIPVVGAAAKGLFSGGADILRRARVGGDVGKGLGVSNSTGRVLANVIGQDDPEMLRQAIARGGPGAMLADASPQATGMLDMAMRSPVPAARSAGRAVEGRASQAHQDITAAMNDAMGGPVGLDAAQGSIRQGTAAARAQQYGDAFGAEIDWRSPQGQDLRSLIATTPKDVLQLAARNRAMKSRAPDMPDGAYRGEFADTVTSKPGLMSGNYAERQDVDSFFNEYRVLNGEKLYKRPIAHTIKKMGGVDPTGKAAQDLRAMGVTPQSSPGLFRRGGIKDLDGLESSRFPDIMAGDGTEYYASPQAIIDGLESEMRGVPLRGTQDEATEYAMSEMDRALPEYQKRKTALKAEDAAMARGPRAPDFPGDIVPTQTVYDIDQIKRALDEVRRTNDGKGLMGGQTEYGVEAGKRAKEMRDLLANISPDYKTALATSADTISRVEAVKTGASILSQGTTREVIRDAVKDASGGELIAMRQGLRSQIDETLANVRAVSSDQNIDARAASKAFGDLSSPAAREKMALVLGDAWPQLRDQLDQAGAALGLRARTGANSATFGRLASDQAIQDEVAPNILQSGNPFKIGASVVRNATGGSPEAVRRMSDMVKGELADVLTRQGTPSAMIKMIEDAMARSPQNPKSGQAVRKIIETLMFGGVGSASAGLQNLLSPLSQSR